MRPASESGAADALLDAVGVELGDPAHGSAFLAHPASAAAPIDLHRVLDDASRLGARSVTFYSFRPGTDASLRAALDLARCRFPRIEFTTSGEDLSLETAALLASRRVAVTLVADGALPVPDPRNIEDAASRAIGRLLIAVPPADGAALTVVARGVASATADVIAGWCRSLSALGVSTVPASAPAVNEPRPGLDSGDAAAVVLADVRRHLARDDGSDGAFTWPPAFAPRSRTSPRPGRACVVTAVGTVVACAGLPLPLGDVHVDPLDEIVERSEVLLNLRRPAHSLKGPCAICAGTTGCIGSRGAAYALTGDYLGSDPTCPRNVARRAQIDVLPACAQRFVPHAEPMLLVDAVASVGDRVAVVDAVVRGDHPFVGADGVLDPVALAEICAQAIAAVEGFATRNRDGAPGGMLLGLRDFAPHGVVRAGDRLSVRVAKSGKLDAFGVFDVRVTRGDDVLGAGRITTWNGG